MSAPQARSEVAGQATPEGPEPRPTPDGMVMLIHESGCTHIKDACTHPTDHLVQPPKWGWIRNPSPGLWPSLSSSNPAKPTEGNTALRGVRRCDSCMWTLSST
ncbi:hypothetical protein QF026_006848 [Streptomyces aurantiacus]|nr:hypothetical protein [Streptomyces aurantiacus]